MRYRLPQTITGANSRWTSRGCAPTDPATRPRSSGCRTATDDFITNDYRVDIQYRGSAGFPPNAIQWRVIYGDGDDLDVRYEPDTSERAASVFLLNPATTYHWKFTWGPRFGSSCVKAA